MQAFKIARAIIASAAAVACIGAAQLAFAPPASANNGVTGLPLPRFVSLKSSRVNMRVGPGKHYQIDWMYMKRGLPMEVIQEYDQWRKVRDSQGSEGWIHHSLISGERTAIVAPWESQDRLVQLLAKPSQEARLVAKIEPGVVAPVDACDAGWCEIDAGSAKGYVPQKLIWGVYPDENFKR